MKQLHGQMASSLEFHFKHFVMSNITLLCGGRKLSGEIRKPESNYNLQAISQSISVFSPSWDT
jgi:hypothetical protein